MTRPLYEGVHGEGERALGQELGMKEARRRLTAHRDSFITEDDFTELASRGFQFVRLPVGYWTFEEDADFVSGEQHVEQALEWAEQNGLGIILDLHGLQGSQNGNDHSGQVGQAKFYEPSNIKRALGTVEHVAKTYGSRKALMGLELINEPKLGFPTPRELAGGQPAQDLARLLGYYDKSLEITARHLPQEVKVLVGDGFQPERMSRALGRRGLRDRVVLDVHHYQAYSVLDRSLTYEQHLYKAASKTRTRLAKLGEQGLLMIGEWSAALPPKALAGMDESQKVDALKRYYDVQVDTFNATAYAQSYWSYKAPGNGVWDYQSQPFVR